ncbi:ribosomal protein S18 acetylase RimI-like enzyme [Vogesella indigofera]|uniref:Ribosomal protein S18 acetylase RimI-like enzyme n=1 Tax=Vogesella indigofera TaxID=45465 RepID=A0A495BDM7_VOGIN|nr:GNAT family N-acetyltransferase [Vogesella indigofera]RKQ59058.1 ribosomal protein S18 acetylase RimI-like enzyme [Vogesella indigofera]
MPIDTFRTATSDDADAIADLVNRAYRPPAGAAGWTHESELVTGARINAAQVRLTLAQDDSHILLGLQQARLCACVNVVADGDGCYIGMLAVDPAIQAGGLGKQMLTHAEQFARQHFQASYCHMTVLSARPELLAYYLRRGYRQTGEYQPFPHDANAGTPLRADLQIEVLRKTLTD